MGKGELLNIEQGHVFICGKSQQGKSYLAKIALFPAYARALFYNTKREHRDLQAKYKTVSSVAELKRFYDQGGTHCVYNPPFLSYDEAADHLDQVCEFVFRLGNIAFFSDEAAGVTKPGHIGHWYYVLMSQGLSRGINVVNISQRPTTCHNSLLSESYYFILFKQSVKTDRDKLKAMAGDIVEDTATLDKYEFLFVGADGSHTKGKL